MLASDNSIPPIIRQTVREMPTNSSATMMVDGYLPFIFKLNDSTLQKLNGKIPLCFENQLGLYPSGAVFLIENVFFPKTKNAFRFPHFFNIDYEKDEVILNALANQHSFHFYFFDNLNQYHFSMGILRDKEESTLISPLEIAKTFNSRLTSIDFTTAKAAMIAELRIPGIPGSMYNNL